MSTESFTKALPSWWKEIDDPLLKVVKSALDLRSFCPQCLCFLPFGNTSPQEDFLKT